MMNKEIPEIINGKIEDIQKKVLSGKISLLDLELVPFFNELKDSLDVYNLDKYSKTYKNACGLLNQKFEELKVLLSSLDTEKKFVEYLKSQPDDTEIYDLFIGCLRKPFTIEALSLSFLELCRDRLCNERSSPITIEHLNKMKSKEKFLLEVPKHKFTEKMMILFNDIKEKLPCFFEDIFSENQKQEEIYENFVYVLHLLQTGKLKYQRETDTLYI